MTVEVEQVESVEPDGDVGRDDLAGIGEMDAVLKPAEARLLTVEGDDLPVDDERVATDLRVQGGDDLG